MAKPSRWNAEKRYQIVKEALSQKELRLDQERDEERTRGTTFDVRNSRA